VSESKLTNLAKALLDDANGEVRDLLSLLTQAQEYVCSMTCRSTFPAGHVRSDADHSALCLRITAALADPGVDFPVSHDN
jgi:hypothetical protein